MKKIEIDGVKYIEATVENVDTGLVGLPYVIIRTYSAGVHAGYLLERKDKNVTLLDSRRLWRWFGAASISQLAVDGTSEPDKCKFPCEVSKIELTEAIEIVYCTDKAKESISKVQIWKA